MNNALIQTEDDVPEDKSLPILRERATHLTEIIEALNAIASSSHWTVLKQFVFDVDLDKAKRRLVIEKDTTEIFRLQGKIQDAEKFSLETLLQKYRDELIAIRKKING